MSKQLPGTARPLKRANPRREESWRGVSTRTWSGTDDAQAVVWFRKAAEKGRPDGMSYLGSMYEDGRGVAQDDAQAVAWFRKAAENGDPEGMINLGVMYERGRGGGTGLCRGGWLVSQGRGTR